MDIILSLFFNYFIRFLFIVTFFFVFSMAVVAIKPLKINKLRKWSTLFLKFSYLFYFFFFLGFIWCTLFFIDNQPGEGEHIFNIGLLIISFVIPNVGIIIRRKIKEFRIKYNYILTVANLLISAYIIYLLIDTNWKAL